VDGWTWIPSDESDVFASDRWVAKIEREGWWTVRREVPAFPVLRAMGFDEFPEIVADHRDLAGHDEPAFALMPRTLGRAFDELWRDDRSLAVWTVARIGDFLRRLETVDWREVPGVVRPDERVASYATWFEGFFAPLLDPANEALTDAERLRVEELFAAMREPPAAFGGWQFAQVLTDGRSTFTAIDWGNLGACWRCHDLAAAVCSLDDFGPDAPAVLRPVLLDAFTAGDGLDDEQSRLLDQWLDLWGFFDRAGRLR
jgi:hypothetical protein